LAVELVDECEQIGVAAENYVFDAWYLSNRLVSHVEAYEKEWISRLKANRIGYYEEKRMNINQRVSWCVVVARRFANSSACYL
jgi:hypothetical protein